MTSIGIVGLGRMGQAMAARFAAQGCAVTGWTRSGRAAEAGQTAPDLATLAATADVLVLSLYDDTAVADVLDALLTLPLAGKLVIDTSTVTPEVLQSRAARFAEAGAAVVDAPISGGPEMVRAGTCGIFLGGADDAAARARAHLLPLSGAVHHVGPLGAGLVMKVINNGMLQIYFRGLVELLPLAAQAGLPFETVLTLVARGPAGLPMLAARLPKALGTDTSVGFSVSAVNKDNAVFRKVVAAHGLSSQTLSAADRHQQQAIAAGLGEADIAAVLRYAYDHRPEEP